MTPTEELERGQLAADVLENEVFKDAMAQLQQEIVTQWQGEKDQLSRDWLWTMNRAAKRLQQVLTDTMQTGKLRQEQVRRDQTKLERLGSKLKVS